MNKFGLKDSDILLIHHFFVRVWTCDQQIRVFIFGSRATGMHKSYSDIDLLIDAEPSLTEVQLRTIKAYLEESNLPYKVDLVTVENLYEPYRQGVESEKQLLFEINNFNDIKRADCS